jgi:hypothetical protein
MKKIIFFFMLISYENFAQKRADQPDFEIDHQPFLVLTATPAKIFDIHNNFMLGAELAPPFGKFSLQADYGFGSRAFNVHSGVRKNYSALQTNIIRGELRTYQSDWFYFSDLDRKPLGRYFAIEYAKKDVAATRSAFVQNTSANYDSNGFYKLDDDKYTQNETLINLKYGKHFLLKRFLVFDVYVGGGIRRYNVKNVNLTQKTGAFAGYLGWGDWLPNGKKILPNGTFGFRICAPF